MNHAHTVPPVAVPWTSPAKAPGEEAGWQFVVAGDGLGRVPCDGAQANVIAATRAAAEIKFRTVSSPIHLTRLARSDRTDEFSDPHQSLDVDALK